MLGGKEFDKIVGDIITSKLKKKGYNIEEDYKAMRSVQLKAEQGTCNQKHLLNKTSDSLLV